MPATRRILLADADAFYVAVARMVDPDGAGKAKLLIVGGSRDSRGVVCSASYETRKYGVSGALLASKAGRKIVPVAHNAGAFWPRRGWLKRPGAIRVAIGPPIEAAGRDPREVNEEVRAWIESTIASFPAEPHSARPQPRLSTQSQQ